MTTQLGIVPCIFPVIILHSFGNLPSFPGIPPLGEFVVIYIYIDR